MTLILDVAEHWGWVGIHPVRIVGENGFGNLIIEDDKGNFWRLCPEELYCRLVAASRTELDVLSKDQIFLRDWYMEELVEQAKAKLGLLRPGYKYALKIPSVLGGKYEDSNLVQLPIKELVSFSGSVARQIVDLPDGAKIEFKIVD